MARPLILSLDVQTKSAQQSLDSFRKKMRSSFTSTDTKALEQNIKNTTKEINKLEGQIEKTKQKLRDLGQIDVKPKSVVAMEKELATLEKQLQKTDAEFEKLSKEQADLAARQVPGLTLEQSLSPEQYARFQELDNLIIKNGEDTEQLTNRINELKAKLAEVKGNPELTAEGKRYNQELDEATKELDNQRQKLQELQEQQNKNNSSQNIFTKFIKNTTNAASKMSKGMGKAVTKPIESASEAVNKFGKRILGLAKRVFIFTVITKALRGLKDTFGALLKSNSQFTSSLAQIKANLWTAFAPIYNAVLPALNTFMSALATATRYVAAFISMLFGKTVKSSQAAAKSLYNTARAYSDTGSAAKDAAKDVEKSTLAFDELNQIQSPNADSGATGGGGGGVVTPDFDSVTDIDTTPLDKFKEKLGPINESLGRLKEALEPFKTFVWQGLVDFYNLCLVPIGNWTLGTGLPRFIDGIANILANVDWVNLNQSLANLWNAVSKFMVETIGEGLLWFYENVIVPLATWALDNLIPAALDLITAAIEFLNEIIEGAKPALLWFWDTFLVPIRDFIWQVVIDFINLLTDAFKALTDWAKNNQDTVENISVAVLGFLAGVWVYNTTKNIITFLKNLGKAFVTFAAGGWKAAVAANMGNIAFGLLAAAILVIAKNWDKMSSMQKVVSVLGALAIAAVSAAAAVGALQSAWSLGAAAAAIVAGIVAITASVKAAKKDATNEFKNLDMDTQVSGSIDLPSDLTNLPYLAQGAVLPPNQPFLAMVGDQKHGTNIEAPLSTIEEAVENVLNKRGYTDNQTININFTGNLSQLARVLNPVIEKEKNRGSTKLVKGGAY